jgi:hypothetical protein
MDSFAFIFVAIFGIFTCILPNPLRRHNESLAVFKAPN